MRGLKNILSSTILSAALCGVAVAAPTTTPAGDHLAPAKSVTAKTVDDIDCQKSGSEVSALIDAKKGSPNISAARATFQVGIMECMEGDDATANKHYQEAKKLLSNDRQAAPVAASKP